MKVYTVHLRRPGPDEDLVMVPEGFSLAAFIFGFLWALYHRLWLFAGGLLAAELLVGGLAYALSLHPMAQLSLNLGVSAIAGYLAQDMRRLGLEGRGYQDMGVVAAPDEDAAARRYLDDHPLLGQAMEAAA